MFQQAQKNPVVKVNKKCSGNEQAEVDSKQVIQLFMNSSAFRKNKQTVDPLKLNLASIFRPSQMTQALTPLKNRVHSDKYLHVKQQYLVEKFLLNSQIEKSNQSQSVVQKVLGVHVDKFKEQKNLQLQNEQSLWPTRKGNMNSSGYYSYYNKTEKDYKFIKFNKKANKINRKLLKARAQMPPKQVQPEDSYSTIN